MRLVRITHMQGTAIDVGVDCHGLQPQFLAAFQQPDSDFASIRNQHFVEQLARTPLRQSGTAILSLAAGTHLCCNVLVIFYDKSVGCTNAGTPSRHLQGEGALRPAFAGAGQLSRADIGHLSSTRIASLADAQMGALWYT